MQKTIHYTVETPHRTLITHHDLNQTLALARELAQTHGHMLVREHRESVVWEFDPGRDAAPIGQYINHYRCEVCAVYWSDQWSCMCNDRCPSCDREIEPFRSDDAA